MARILMLHNDNLPNVFYEEQGLARKFNIENVTVRISEDAMDFDAEICAVLNPIFQREPYDLIVLPYTFDTQNYMSFTGVRTAVHIRLTQLWGHTRKPILFVGPDAIEQVEKLSSMGSLFLTSLVYHTNLQSKESLISLIDDCMEKSEMTDVQYRTFLEKVQVSRPSNYQTHHSLANEWAVRRWVEMLSWDEEPPVLPGKDIFDMLFYKYLYAHLATKHEVFSNSFKKKNPIKPVINGIENKTIVYVDDEYNKGWEKLLKIIVENSGAKLVCYKDFNEAWKRDKLVQHINDFLDTQADAHCYLIDLRLHEEDFGGDPTLMTGHQVVKHLFEKRQNTQVVVFTASNKVWNMKQEMSDYHVSDYIIKESPEFNFSRNETKQNFNKFLNAIKKAACQYYIRDYQKELEKLPAQCPKGDLMEFVSLLSLDSDERKNKVLKSLLLSLHVFIENYILNVQKFAIDGSGNLSGPNGLICNFNKKMFFQYDKSGVSGVKGNKIDVKFEDKLTLKAGGWEFAPTDSEKSKDTIQVAALHYYYGFDASLCKLFLNIKKDRNTVISHCGGMVTGNIEDVKKLFQEMIMVMLHKDYPPFP